MPTSQRAVSAVTAVTALAALATAAAVGAAVDGVGAWSAVVAFAALAVAAEMFGQSMYGSTTVSLSAVPVLAAAAAGEPVAALVAATAAGVTTTVVAGSRRLLQYVFNPAALVVCAGAAVAVFEASPWSSVPALVLAGLIAGLAYFAVDNALVALVAGADSGRAPADVFRRELSWLLPSFAAYGLLAAVLGSAWTSAQGWGVLAFLVPPLLVRFGQRQYLRRTAQQVAELHRQTAAALAGAIDARDAGTGGHVDRVTVLGHALLEQVAPDLAADPQLAFGFLLHDVGKIGVPDAVLRKAGDLTMAERAVMDTHPQVGWDIVEQAGFSPAVGKLVLTHHERWDGTGYPGGLRGDEIPLSARLFAVVDALDAMTSDRPYRQALPLDRALDELRAGAGTQFDPAAVEGLLGLGTPALRVLLGLPDVITLPADVPHQAGSEPIWSSTPA